MRASDTPEVLFRKMPVPSVAEPFAPDLLAIVPPLAALPVPFTFRPPFAPVVLRMMPLLLPPLDEMLWNSRLLLPMVVLLTFSAVAVVVVILLTFAPVAPGLQGFSSQTSTVPPPVAAKAGLGPVESTRPPEKRMVAPVLVVSDTPLPSP